VLEHLQAGDLRWVGGEYFAKLEKLSSLTNMKSYLRKIRSLIVSRHDPSLKLIANKLNRVNSL